MPASPGSGPATSNSTFDRGDKLELPNQPRPEEATALNLASSSSPDSFNPGWSFYASFTSLCIISLAVALDATSLSIALPVRAPTLDYCEALLFFSSTLHFSDLSAPWGTSIKFSDAKIRSSPNLSTVAPSPPSGAGHPSSYPPPCFSPPSLLFPTYSAANLSFSRHSFSSQWVH